MITRQDVVEQQRHPCLGQGSHVGAYDSHPSPGSGPGKILTWYAKQLSDGLLIKSISPVPPLTVFALLALLQY